MKRIICSLLLFTVFSSHAEYGIFGPGATFLPPTNVVNMATVVGSYDVSPNYYYFLVMATYVSGMNNHFTNGIIPLSQSGSSLQNDLENNIASKFLPYFHTMDTNITAWCILYSGGDNGGYSSNQVVQYSTNIMKGLKSVWNSNLGAFTNEPNITTPFMVFIPKGAIPADSAGGGGSNVTNRNNAAVYLDNLIGVVSMETFFNLITNGVEADRTSNRYFGFLPGDHPYPAGYSCMAQQDILSLKGETNIGSTTIDFLNATVRSTNWMVLSGMSRTGNRLTWTHTNIREPGAWKKGYGTNGCDDAFLLMPYLANKFQWTIQVTNLPAGNYQFALDGTNVCVLTSVQLAAGWNMYTNTTGAFWGDRMRLWIAYCHKLGVDPDTLLPTHDSSADFNGFGGNSDVVNYTSAKQAYPNTTGAAFLSLMANSVNGLKVLDKLIYDESQPVPHTASLTLVNNLTATTITTGTLTIGQ